MRKGLVIVIGVVVLGLINYSIYSREQLVTQGKKVFLELAPVDPRSLIQGDYMALRFKVTGDARSAMIAARKTVDQEQPTADGHVILALDEQGIGRFVRIDDGSQLAKDEIRMRYRKRGHKIKFATNAFFFQEGHAEPYEAAKFGEFRVAEDGDSILVDMWDEGLKKIEP